MEWNGGGLLNVPHVAAFLFSNAELGAKIGISRLRCLPDFRSKKPQRFGTAWRAEDRESLRFAMFLSSAARFPHGVHGFSSRNCL